MLTLKPCYVQGHWLPYSSIDLAPVRGNNTFVTAGQDRMVIKRTFDSHNVLWSAEVEVKTRREILGIELKINPFTILSAKIKHTVEHTVVAVVEDEENLTWPPQR